jgi:hypothetical protein
MGQVRPTAGSQNDKARVEVMRRVEDGSGDVPKIRLADLAVSVNPGRSQSQNDLVHGTPTCCAAAVEHVPAKLGDREFADMQDNDVVSVVPDQLAGHVNCGADMPEGVARRDIDRQENAVAHSGLP